MMQITISKQTKEVRYHLKYLFENKKPLPESLDWVLEDLFDDSKLYVASISKRAPRRIPARIGKSFQTELPQLEV